MPIRLFFPCVLLLISVPGLSLRADNWERFRGPNGEGISNDRNVPVTFGPKENLRWKAEIPGMGHSSPVVWGDRVFLQTASNDASTRSLICLDAKTGKEVWSRTIPGIKPKQTVRFDSSLASATPTTDGEAVFVPFWDGKDVILTAYNFKGDKLWDRNFGEFVSQHGAGASPIVYKNLVIFSVDKDAFRDTTKRKGPVSDPSTLYALDKKTGKTVWETPREAVRACYSVPFLLEKQGGSPELIVTSTTAITSYHPETGKSNWYWTWTFPKDPLRTIAATTYANGTLLACSGDGSGERFMVGVTLKGTGKETRPEQIWSNAKAKESPYVPCPLIKGDEVYFVNDVGYAGCYDAKTGNKIYYERIPDTKFYASPIMVNGKVYAVSESGDVFVYPATPKFEVPRPTASLGETVRATPAVADGAIFIRTKSSLYCFGK